MAACAPCRAAGSSPRGRGKLYMSSPIRSVVGLIPARAGKTSPKTRPPAKCAAHPRAGGENDRDTDTPVSFTGSSPRGRGKRGDQAVKGLDDRLIPARAGKTKRRRLTRPLTRAHPRAGGENHGHVSRPRGEPGSSPRGRGKLVNWPRVVVDTRLIPARAGKTPARPRRSRSEWAHPRAGGENIYVDWQTLHDTGSSPRGRGKHSHASALIAAGGLIPARAGKTPPVLDPGAP